MQKSVEVFTDFTEQNKPNEECGIVVVATPAGNASELAAIAATQLDNRGKECTGLAEFSPEGTVRVTKGFGTGKEVFYEDDPENAGQRRLKPTGLSYTAQSQTRYSTQGTHVLDAAQPHAIEITGEHPPVHFSHIHNGNLTNTSNLAMLFGVEEDGFHSDSHLMAYIFGETMREMLAKNPDDPLDLRDVVLDTVQFFEGAFAGVISTPDQTVAYTDHHGLKPAVIGEDKNGGIFVTSEVTALDAVDARLVREMQPGELVIIEDGSWYAEQWAEPEPKGCLLEVFYFMRPEGVKGTKALFHGVEIEAARRRAGEVLAETTLPVEDADFVFGLPASGVLAGKGYADVSGAEYSETAVLLRQAGRSFISPTQKQRRDAVRAKFNPDRDVIEGKRAIAIDDSLIRGTTMDEFASMYFEQGARELHIRIAFSLVKEICDLGVDMGDPLEMLANHYEDLEGMAVGLGVDSIAFLEVKDILGKVIGSVAEGAEDKFCTGCLTGEYPNKQPQLVHPYYFQD